MLAPKKVLDVSRGTPSRGLTLDRGRTTRSLRHGGEAMGRMRDGLRSTIRAVGCETIRGASPLTDRCLSVQSRCTGAALEFGDAAQSVADVAAG